jgi:hypothetical protein
MRKQEGKGKDRRKYCMKRKDNDVKRRASTEKIAYYVQGLCKEKVDIGNVILVVKSQFTDDDIKEFADKYYEYSNYNNVRYVANLLRSISPKDINQYLQKFTL